MNELKRILFDAYGGFADKRYKKLEKSSRFIIDDRSDVDFGADRNLYSFFCMIFADVKTNHDVVVTLTGNIPSGKAVDRWLEEHDLEIKTLGYQERLEIPIKQGEQGKLTELATAFRSIVAPGARYKTANYKYVCPRTATSLTRFAKMLDEVWSQNLPQSRRGFF